LKNVIAVCDFQVISFKNRAKSKFLRLSQGCPSHRQQIIKKVNKSVAFFERIFSRRKYNMIFVFKVFHFIFFTYKYRVQPTYYMILVAYIIE